MGGVYMTHRVTIDTVRSMIKLLSENGCDESEYTLSLTKKAYDNAVRAGYDPKIDINVEII